MYGFKYITIVSLFAFSLPAIGKKRSVLVKSKKKSRPAYQVGVGVGIPHPVDFGVGYRNKDYLFKGSLGQYSNHFVAKNKREFDLKIQHIQGQGRMHPFKDPFFFGVDVGYQNISLDGTAPVKVNVDGVEAEINVAANMDISALYWTPPRIHK